MVRVALFTNIPMLAAGVTHTLSGVEGVDLAFSCKHPADLLDQIRVHQPDVVLLDRTPEVTFRLLAELRRRVPKCNIVLWIRTIPVELAYLVMELGVRGILRQALPEDRLVECLRRVAAGELWFERQLTTTFLAAKTITLSRRERQLVALVARGLSNKEIAETLDLSEPSVRNYLTKVFQKVGVQDRFELAIFGLRNLLQAAPGHVDREEGPSPQPVLDREDLAEIARLRFLVVEKSHKKPDPEFESEI